MAIKSLPRAGWTLDGFRELESYSQARGVTIVPKLEVPGHSTILRRKRPDVFGENPLELATTPKAQKGVEILDVFKSTLTYETYAGREDSLLEHLEAISGFKIPEMPIASPETTVGNLDYGAKVNPSNGATQPYFVPARLTNGITEPFDLFLGYPTKPEPLVIDIELLESADASRIRIFEIGVRNGWKKYRLFVSADGITFKKVGATITGQRGDKKFVEHQFKKQK